MGYAVVHMMKIKSGAVGGIQSHNKREHEPKTNPDVDMSRSADNYDLVPCDNYRRAIKEKLSDLVESGRAVRKDAVVVCNFIVTSDYDTMEELGAEKQRAFFEDSVKWFSNRYGADRVLNATVHMDETTPHMHIGVLPITQDGRLSAKSIFTKTELKAIQTEFARDVGEKYGLERGVEGSERTHLSEIRFKEECATQSLDEAIALTNEMGALANVLEIEAENSRQELKEATRSLEKVKQEVLSMQDQKDALRGEIEGLKGEKAEMEQEIPVLTARIIEAKSELVTVENAIKEKKAEGTGQFGSMEEMNRAIARQKEKDAREARLSLLERFVSLPQIKPLWERFVELVSRNGRDNRGKSDKTDRER